MVGSALGVCLAFQQPWQRRRLSCLLAVIAVLMAAVPTPTIGDCPATNPDCQCKGTFSITCENMGNLSQVPPWTPSSNVYYYLRIQSGTSGTTLSTIQTAAFKGVKTQRLFLEYIGLTTVQSRAFSELGDVLIILYIQHNPIETFQKGAFDGLNQLELLWLAPNRLKSVSAEWWGQLPALGRLFIHYNEIDTILDGAFNNLTQLKTLDLAFNRLKTVRYDFLRYLVHLEVLYLEKNPYHCDCQLAWVREKRAILKGNPPICASPPSVSGTSVLVYNIPVCPTTTTETGISVIFLTYLNIQ